MKKILGLVFILVLFLTGCTDEGILRINSNSSENVWYELDYGPTEWLSQGESDLYSWDLSTSLFEEEYKEITVSYGGDYWFWYDYETTKTIKPGKTTSVNIIGDAGEIEIWNNSNSFYITEVYLSPSDELTWGSDDLNGMIGPAESVVWKVTVGSWDIRIVDNYDDEFIKLDQYIPAETKFTYMYTGFRKTENANGEKIDNAKNCITITKDLCEKR